MEADAARQLAGMLAAHGVDACVGGGWAVDALLGGPTRPHGDLDLWLPAQQFELAVEAFVAAGIDRLYPWGDERPWNFVLHDGDRRRVDLHLYEPLDADRFHYGSVVDGETFPLAALAGSGMIGGAPVRCEAPEWSVRWHTGYPPRSVDHHDVTLLCERFGLELPTEFR